MSSKFVFKVALRYFSEKKSEKLISIVTLLSLLGIAIGVATLIIVMAVMNGFRQELMKNIVGSNGEIRVKSFDGEKISFLSDVISQINAVAGIKKTIPIIEGQGFIIVRERSSGVLVKGLDLHDLMHNLKMQESVLLNKALLQESNTIILGVQLANHLGVGIGDNVKLFCPNGSQTIIGFIPRMKIFTVVGVINSGMYDYDNTIAVIDRHNAARMFLSDSIKDISNVDESNANALEIYLHNVENTQTVLYGLRNILGKNLIASSWQELNKQFFDALKIEQVTMFTILTLIIVVAAFNIISSLFMMVKEKSRDISILRTLGASKRQIMLIFMLNGSLIGILGTLLGVLLGVGFALNIDNLKNIFEKALDIKLFEAAIYFLYNLPAKLVLKDILMVTILAISLSILVTIYPSYKAASLDPVEGLRDQ